MYHFLRKPFAICALLFCLSIPAQAQAPLRCGVDLPGQAARIPLDATSPTPTPRAVVTIPVVVHVVWNKQAENISDEQILSQMEVLNKDFRALNAQIPSIPQVFQGKIADVEIEFCLANRDPNGNATTGITRTFTQNSVGIGGTTALHYTAQGGKDAWDTQRYLNIWVCKFAGGVGGTATFPGQGPAQEDGVEIDYRQFGTINTIAPYHLGRTTTHEIGHYLNLEHVWGPSINSCCEDDFVADTPPACETYLGECPVHPVQSCTGPDMFMNYMFYTDDSCMGMFTKGQKERMWATLNGFRAGLLSSNGCQPLSTGEHSNKLKLFVFQNPFHRVLAFEIKSERSGQATAFLHDSVGRVLKKESIGLNAGIEWNTADLSAGVYTLRVDPPPGETGRIIKRVVKL